MKIRTQVTLTFFVLFAFTLICFSLYDFYRHRKNILAETFHQLKSLATTQKKLLESTFLTNLERLVLVTSSQPLKLNLARYNETQAEESLQKINQILQEDLQRMASLQSISLLNLQGQVLASTDAALVGNDHFQKDFFIQGKAQPQTDYFFLDESKQLKLRFSGPLLFQGKLLGVLLMEADAKNLIDLMNTADLLGKSCEMVLVQKNKTGDVVFVTPSLSNPMALQPVVSKQASHSLALRAFENEEGQMENGKNHQQESVYAVTKRLQNPGLALVVSVHQSEMLHQLEPLRNQIILLALAVMGVAFFASWLLANFLTKPLSDLTQTVVEIAQGDLEKEIKSPSFNHEIGILAQTLNQMKNKFVESLKEIRQKNEELRTANGGLKTAQAQLIQSAKLASLGEMATGIAHELNQPLQIIQMSIELGQENLKLRNRIGAREHYRIIEKQVDRAAAIISHLKTFGRETSKVQFNNVSVNQVIKDSLILINNQFRNQNIEVVQELVGDLPWIKGNAVQIEQVFMNLLLNAKDAMGGRSQKIIKICSWQEEDQVKIEIEDNGIGMEEATQNQIFDPFFTTKDVGEGTGLGLSISHSIIQDHQGALKVRSVPEQGSVFTLSFPIAS